jgi:POT family proton-dependent oligopeptide transporter
MLLSLVVFTVFRRHYAAALAPREAGAGGPSAAGDDAVGFGGRVAALAILYLVSTMFWALFFQNGFALTLWAKDCTARPGWLTEEMFQAVNPTCIVILSSVAAWFWRRMGEREPATPDKILLGLFAAIATASIMIAASFMGGDGCVAGGKGVLVSLGWLVATYVMVSLAEILVSPMGLSYCTKVAPRQLGGLVMGGWFASLAAGGYLSGFMGSHLWESVAHSTYFGILTAGVAAVAVLLLVVRNILKRAAR